MTETNALKDFFAAWTTNDADSRRALIASAIGARFHYVDPRTPEPITSAPAMDAYAGQFLENCPPGASVEVLEPVDVKLGHFRATVMFVMSPEMRQTGQYFGDLDDNGKITRLVGFVGKGAE